MGTSLAHRWKGDHIVLRGMQWQALKWGNKTFVLGRALRVIHKLMSLSVSVVQQFCMSRSIFSIHTHPYTHQWAMHCHTVCIYRLIVQSRFFPSPTCQQWWIVFPLQPLSLCCGWRLESWPNILRAVSISCWHLTANNKSMWGLHLRPLPFCITPCFCFIHDVQLNVAWHPVSVHQSLEPLTASLLLYWPISLNGWLSKGMLCGRQVM